MAEQGGPKRYGMSVPVDGDPPTQPPPKPSDSASSAIPFANLGPERMRVVDAPGGGLDVVPDLAETDVIARAETTRSTRHTSTTCSLERVTELEEKLRQAIDFAIEGWGYASPYFREKWYEEELAELQAALQQEDEPW